MNTFNKNRISPSSAGFPGSRYWHSHDNNRDGRSPMPKFTTGFTLIEIMVSIAVVTLLGTIVLFSYRTFSNRLAVSAAMQEISIAVRQAQTYALSIKETGKGSGDFTSGYGVSFDSRDPKAYYIFADKNHNNIYDGDSTCAAASECIEKDIIRNNVSISSTMCGTNDLGVQGCPIVAKIVTITFLRPDPDARIYFIDSRGYTISGQYQNAQIKLVIPGEPQQGTVSFDSTGQISTQ